MYIEALGLACLRGAAPRYGHRIAPSHPPPMLRAMPCYPFDVTGEITVHVYDNRGCTRLDSL
jgi:hypothetical protein